MDIFTPEQRSLIMSSVKGKNTKPEILIRKLLHSLGYRFRIHRKDLPGKPDIVLPRYKTVIFINGCFWHQHQGCKASHIPASHAEYWRSKLERNAARDKKNIQILQSMGWRVIVIWECEINDIIRSRQVPGLPTHKRGNYEMEEEEEFLEAAEKANGE